MPRPPMPRCIRFRPHVRYFKPQGIPLRALETIVLLPDEMEALKLYSGDGLDQKHAAEEMRVSQPTFARILHRAHQKIAEALLRGKAIQIEGGQV